MCGCMLCTAANTMQHNVFPARRLKCKSVGNNYSRWPTLTNTGVHADSQLGPENHAVLFPSGPEKAKRSK